MKTVNMHEAKTHLSRLVTAAAAGEPFVIARAGKPLVKVVAVEEAAPVKRSPFGFLAGEFVWDEAADREADEAVRRMFEDSVARPLDLGEAPVGGGTDDEAGGGRAA